MSNPHGCPSRDPADGKVRRYVLPISSLGPPDVEVYLDDDTRRRHEKELRIAQAVEAGELTEEEAIESFEELQGKESQ